MEYRLRSIISPAWICSYESLSDFRRSTSTLAGSFERTGRTQRVAADCEAATTGINLTRDVKMQADELIFLREAIRLAKEAEQKGNLPIGAVIVLDGQIIARGMNAIWQPAIELTRHAEIESLRSLPPNLLASCAEMTLFTTLEPCLMCAGAILLHQIGVHVDAHVNVNAGVVHDGSVDRGFSEYQKLLSEIELLSSSGKRTIRPTPAGWSRPSSSRNGWPTSSPG